MHLSLFALMIDQKNWNKTKKEPERNAKCGEKPSMRNVLIVCKKNNRHQLCNWGKNLRTNAIIVDKHKYIVKNMPIGI